MKLIAYPLTQQEVDRTLKQHEDHGNGSPPRVAVGQFAYLRCYAPQPKGQSDEEYAAERVKRALPAGTPYKIINRPAEIVDEFRVALDFDAESESGFVVNMDRAKLIHNDRIRQVRNEKFAPLDEEYNNLVRGQEIGRKIDEKKAAAVDAKRQSLRDAPASVADAIEKAKTIEELKAIWPESLN